MELATWMESQPMIHVTDHHQENIEALQQRMLHVENALTEILNHVRNLN